MPRPRIYTPAQAAKRLEASRRRYQAKQSALRAERAAQLYAIPPGHYTREEAWQLYNRLAPGYSLPPLATANSFAARCQQVPAIIPHRRPRYHGGHCYTEEHVRTLLESTAAGHARRQRRWGRSLPAITRRTDARHLDSHAALELYNQLAPAYSVRTLSDPLYLNKLLHRFDVAPANIIGHRFYWSRSAIREALRRAAVARRARGRAISRAHRQRAERTAAAAKLEEKARRRAERTSAAAKLEEKALRRAERAAAAAAKLEEKTLRRAERAAAATAKLEEKALRREERAAAAAAKLEEKARRKAARAAAATAKRRAAARRREEKHATHRRYPVAPPELLASGKLLTPAQFAAVAHCTASYIHHLVGLGVIIAYHHPQRLRPILIHAPHAAAVLLERANQPHHQP